MDLGFPSQNKSLKS